MFVTHDAFWGCFRCGFVAVHAQGYPRDSFVGRGRMSSAMPIFSGFSLWEALAGFCLHKIGHVGAGCYLKELGVGER